MHAADLLAAHDLRAALALIARAHAATSPEALVPLVAAGLAGLLHADRVHHHDVDLADRDAAAWRPGTPRLVGGRLRLAVPVGAGRLVGFDVSRRARFEPRDLAVAGLVRSHLGDVFDHVRLRHAQRSSAGEVLTAREREVLELVAAGRSSRDVGRVLLISPRTVEKHVEHARDKLGASSRAEAVALLVGVGSTPDGGLVVD